MQGIITDIHRASTVDGPGLRTAVFLKGCPLRCIWCHNPETQNFAIEHGFGRMATATEIIEECEKDRVYYEESGGGVTLSGGEPLAQAEFTREILQGLKAAGLHTALDTTGYPACEAYELVLPFTDLFLFDYKATDPAKHYDLVGCTPDRIRRTLEFLLEGGAQVLLRCPLVPGVNDDTEHLKAIADLARQHPKLVGIDLLPWHTMGRAKYAKLGRPIDPRLPTENVPEATRQRYRRFFAEHGATHVEVKA